MTTRNPFNETQRTDGVVNLETRKSMSCLDRYIERVVQVQSRKELDEIFLSFLEQYNVMNVVAHLLPFGAARVEGTWQPILSTYPAKVSEHYRSQRCADWDPFMDKVLRAGIPVQYSEVKDEFEWTANQQEMFDIMHECGLRDGLGMPVFAKPGVAAYFSLTYDKVETVSRADRITLQTACQQYFARQRELEHGGDCKMMTNRERQIMVGIINGKSNPMIATALGISEHTVDTYVRRLFAKLGASSRLEVAMKCLCAGTLIQQLFELDERMCA